MASKLILAAVAASCAALSACSEYERRAEGISPFAGDAVRANIAIHTIDPWPKGASQQGLVIGADRQVERMKTFNEPRASSQSGGGGGAAAGPALASPPPTP